MERPLIGGQCLISGREFGRIRRPEYSCNRCVCSDNTPESNAIAETHRIIEPGQVNIAVRNPLVELHGVVRRITLAIGSQTEHSQRVGDILELQQLLHVALLGIGDHALEPIADTLLGQSASELLTGSGLRPIEDDQAASGCLELFNKRVVRRTGGAYCGRSG